MLEGRIPLALPVGPSGAVSLRWADRRGSRAEGHGALGPGARGDSHPRDLIDAGSDLCFIAEAIVGDTELWRSDGIPGVRVEPEAADRSEAAVSLNRVGGRADPVEPR